MNKIIKQKLKKIIEYAESNSDWIEQIIVFGEALTENSENAVIRLAVEFVDNSGDPNKSFNETIKKCYGKIVRVVSELTDNRFEVLILNGDNLTDDALFEIEKGRIIYGVQQGE